MITSVLYDRDIYYDIDRKEWFYSDTRLPVWCNDVEKENQVTFSISNKKNKRN